MAKYDGTVDEDKVSDLIRQFGELVTDAGEVGFILTYHAVDKPGMGRMDLASKGITHKQLEVLLRGALERHCPDTPSELSHRRPRAQRHGVTDPRTGDAVAYLHMETET